MNVPNAFDTLAAIVEHWNPQPSRKAGGQLVKVAC